MDPVIDLAPGAEGIGLAQRLATLIRQNVSRNPRTREAFRRFRGAIALLGDDSGIALTLRFDFGRLIIHSGIVGLPDVTVLGGHRAIDVLAALPRPTLGSWFDAVTPGAGLRAALDGVARALRSGEVKIYGLGRHPRVVARFIQFLSERA